MKSGRAIKLIAKLFASWILSLAIFTSAAYAFERTVNVTHTADKPIQLTERFDILIDASKALTISNVAASAKEFSPSHSFGTALGFAYTTDAVWLNFRVANTSDQAVEQVFEIAYALLSKVDFYQPSADGYKLTQLGYSRPFATQPHRSRFIVMPFSVPAKTEQTIFLRIESANSMHIPARLWTNSAFDRYEHSSYSVQALYFGIVLGLAIYNLMLYFALRDTNYLLYFIFALSVSAALAGYAGFGAEFIWGDYTKASMSGVNVFSCIAAIAILQFTRRVLNTKSIVPYIDRLISVFTAANFIALVMLLFWFETFTAIFAMISGSTAVFLLLTGLIFAYKRQRSAYYFLAAFAIILLGVAVAHLRNLGLLPTNVFTSDGAQIGSAIEMLLLSFALADRYNSLRRENQKVQADALRAQSELVRRLQTSEQLLETKVSERTFELQSLNQQLEAMSSTDSLTGIANRRRFDTVLASEWERAKRLGQPLAVAMVDVDWFKKYNDHYGHQAGDECLRRVAQALTASIGRVGDLVARYGGEEFAFIAPTTDSEKALNIARRACETIDALALSHAGSNYGHVTISVGIASVIPRDDISIDDLIGAADKAVYSAKAEGRNRVAQTHSVQHLQKL